MLLKTFLQKCKSKKLAQIKNRKPASIYRYILKSMGYMYAPGKKQAFV